MHCISRYFRLVIVSEPTDSPLEAHSSSGKADYCSLATGSPRQGIDFH